MNEQPLLNRSILKIFRQALRVSFRDPSYAGFIALTIVRELMNIGRRKRLQSLGYAVPPFLIASITKSCNLNCKGCYQKNREHPDQPDLKAEEWSRIFREAGEMGVSFILLAGGEPVIRKDVLESLQNHPEIIFPLFTNGLLLDPVKLKVWNQKKNIVPVISIEGMEKETDCRRGNGVFQVLEKKLRELSKSGVFTGVSLTVTRDNLRLLTGKDFVRRMIGLGVKLFFYVEYVPVEPGTENLALTETDRKFLQEKTTAMKKEQPALFIAFPGDEEKFGGCLAAGRGFVHISHSGSLEPCPFSPFSRDNLTGKPLLEALQSGFLKQIRGAHAGLTETGGCALWARKDWVRELSQNQERI